jgi:DNA-binding MarR family transcriptional regulator
MSKRASTVMSTAAEGEVAPVKASSKRKARTAYLLTQAHFAMRLRVDDALKNFDITGLQYTVLSMVALHPGLSSAELSRRFFRTQQSMGQLLSGLVERGWLTRDEHPENRRILRVTLTDPGRRLVSDGGDALDAVEDAAFSAFSAADIKVFRTILESVAVR